MRGTFSMGEYRASEGCLACLPDRWKGDGTRYGVIECRGASSITAGQGALVYQQAQYAVEVMALTQAGYPVVCADLCGTAYMSSFNFGNDDAIAALTAAYNYLTTTLGAKVGKVLLSGGSGGGGTIFSWARANIAKVLAIACAIPLLDVNDVYVNNKSGYRAAIGTAFGVTYPTAIPNLATHSAAAFSNADLAAIGSVPVKLSPSDDDPLASNTAACTTWAAAVAAAGGTIPVVVESTGANGHGTGNFFASATSNGNYNVAAGTYAKIRFFDAAGGRN